MSFLRAASIVLVVGAVMLVFGARPGIAAGRAAEATNDAAPAHAAGDAHGGDSKPNPLEFDPDLAFFTLIIFLVLLAVLWKFAWGPIAQALDLREQKIADNIAAAQSCNDEAKRLLAEYEAKLASAREEVRGILEEARRDAEHAGQEIVAKARADAGVEIQRGKREIETATAQALKELAETSANLAVDLAGRIVQSKLNPADHARLIEDAMAAFPKGDHGRN
ncbi:MAG: F0F1 ATP synthase subunit B [Planctomycetia bacterium]|nr:F0F1 ATP synthase subunit B [Planctomycetia bacterium]